jgi:hypothetical protein
MFYSSMMAPNCWRIVCRSSSPGYAVVRQAHQPFLSFLGMTTVSPLRQDRLFALLNSSSLCSLCLCGSNAVGILRVSVSLAKRVVITAVLPLRQDRLFALLNSSSLCSLCLCGSNAVGILRVSVSLAKRVVDIVVSPHRHIVLDATSATLYNCSTVRHSPIADFPALRQ